MRNNLGMMKMLCVVSVLFIVEGCAQQKHINQEIDRELKSENSVKTNEELSREARALIENSNELTSDQKTKLYELQSRTRQKTKNYFDQSVKLRAILIEDLIQKKYERKKIDMLKKRLKDVEAERIETMLSSIDEANIILGHELKERKRILETFNAGDRF